MNGIRLYNTLTRKIEKFVPQDPKKVKIYTCGPTVYSTPHVGNLAAYVYWDLLIRTLKANGYTPYRVINLTDVGHLVSDSDEGEDKLEKGARQSGKTVWEVAEKYIREFKSAYKSLNLKQPAVWARATDYIQEDIQIIDKLYYKQYAYIIKDGIYFDTSKFLKYADFAKLNLSGQLCNGSGRLSDNDEKYNCSDFALWKFIQPGEKHAMRWNFLDRPGYPGWHLECSAIIHKELGEPIDIHAGGIDHIPVHHTNEIAQSEAAFDKRLAKYWLHCNHLTINGKKISKSEGNGYSLRDLKRAGYSPLDFKMWVLQGHYQSERDFTISNLEAAKKRRLMWRNQIAKIKQGYIKKDEPPHVVDERVLGIIDILNDNLNSPKAFSVIDNINSDSLTFWKKIEELFGLGLFKDKEPTKEQLALIQARGRARARKDFTESDRLRDELAKHNLTILDTPDGQVWQYQN